MGELCREVTTYRSDVSHIEADGDGKKYRVTQTFFLYYEKDAFEAKFGTTFPDYLACEQVLGGRDVRVHVVQDDGHRGRGVWPVTITSKSLIETE